MKAKDCLSQYTKLVDELKMANKQLLMQREYFKELNLQIEKVYKINHDIRHFINVINHCVNSGEFEKLKDIIGDYDNKTEIDKLPVFCNNFIANTIIGFFYTKAKKNNVEFRCKAFIPEDVNISESDLCVILANIIENAIDACKLLEPETRPYISLKARIMNNTLIFKVENTYNGIIKIKDGKYQSIKAGDGHGIGMRNVIEIVELYNGFATIEHDDQIFKFTIIIPYK